MNKEKREILVFIASPGDLSPERQVFRQTLDELNKGFGDGAGVTFVPLGWEASPATTGVRVQSVINTDVDRCAVFILALHRRWGQKAPDSKFSSYTEEEFYRALERFEQTKKTPIIWVFLKNVDQASVADAGPELAKVLDFRKTLEARRDTLMKTFGTETEFGQMLDDHLRKFASGRWDHLDVAPETVSDRSLALRSSAENVPSALAPDLSLVKADKEVITLARAAEAAAQNGLSQDASILFAKATQGTTNLQVLEAATEFYRKIGDSESVNNLVRRQSAIARDRTIAARQYLSLLPPNFLQGALGQAVERAVASEPPELADDMRSILNEAFDRGNFEEFALSVMVKHYSDAELAAMSHWLGAPEGQSAFLKQGAIAQEFAGFGAREVARVLEKRGLLPAQVENPALPPSSTAPADHSEVEN